MRRFSRKGFLLLAVAATLLTAGCATEEEGDSLGQVVKLAYNYGPFLFAIIFTLIVPDLAYRNFRDCMIKFPKPSKSQSSLIRHSAIYFRSTWIAGLVLIAFSVAWWLYLNWNVVRHADEQYWISYEGDIYGVVDDDLLDSPPDSRIYMWAKKDQDFHYRFLVLNHSPVSVEQPFSILWFSKTRIGAQSSGVGPKSVKFHLDPGKTIYQLKREGSEISIVANN